MALANQAIDQTDWAQLGRHLILQMRRAAGTVDPEEAIRD